VKDLKHYKRIAGKTKGSMGFQGTNAVTKITGQLHSVINKRLQLAAPMTRGDTTLK
jgi:hypothetical protein